jgi:hypothetical protein
MDTEDWCGLVVCTRAHGQGSRRRRPISAHTREATVHHLATHPFLRRQTAQTWLATAKARTRRVSQTVHAAAPVSTRPEICCTAWAKRTGRSQRATKTIATNRHHNASRSVITTLPHYRSTAPRGLLSVSAGSPRRSTARARCKPLRRTFSQAQPRRRGTNASPGAHIVPAGEGTRKPAGSRPLYT